MYYSFLASVPSLFELQQVLLFVQAFTSALPATTVEAVFSAPAVAFEQLLASPFVQALASVLPATIVELVCDALAVVADLQQLLVALALLHSFFTSWVACVLTTFWALAEITATKNSALNNPINFFILIFFKCK